MKSPIPIYDCHGHLGTHPDFPSERDAPDEMVRVMDLLNISVMAITSTRACYNNCPEGNSEVADVLHRFPRRFRGYVTANVNPPGEAIAELERWSGFHSPPLIKLHPDLHQYAVSAPECRPIWDYANQTRAVVLVHTWDSDPRCGPLLLAPIAREFPRATIIIGHSGVTWNGYFQAMETALEARNTFLDITGSQSHRTILEAAAERVGAERILFGSDMPFLEAAMALGRVLTARISDAAKERILRDNFRALLEEA